MSILTGLANTTDAFSATIDLIINASLVITLPSGSVMQKTETRWTPSTNELIIAVTGSTDGKFTLLLNKVGTTLKWTLSQEFE